MSRPHLDELHRSLEGYSAESVSARIRALLDERARRGVPSEGKALSRVLWQELPGIVGPWYVAGPQVGDETVSGFCWCHSFVRAFEGDSRSARIDAATTAVMVEIEWARQWRESLLNWLQGRTGLSANTLEIHLVALVGQLVEQGVHDSWYGHVVPAACWMCEAAGIEVDPELEEQLDALVSTSFTSWVEPGPAARESFAEAAAWRVIEAKLDGS